MREPFASTDDGRVSARAWMLLVFLTALNVLNFVDRTLISSLGPLLIRDLGLSRAQIGLLAGYGFVFFYTLVGLFFGIPGLGSYTIDAIQAQDFAVVRAMVFIGSVLYIVGLLLTDLSYTLVDPRVRLE